MDSRYPVVTCNRQVSAADFPPKLDLEGNEDNRGAEVFSISLYEDQPGKMDLLPFINIEWRSTM